MFGRHAALNRMAMRVTVGDVCSPLLSTFSAQTSASAARRDWEEICKDLVPSDPLDHVSLVFQGDTPMGWIGFEMIANEDETPVSQCMEPLSWKAVISADTPLLEAAKLFDRESPYTFLVLRGNQLTDWLSYQGLLSLPFRACLFSMLLGIEELLSEIALTDSTLAVSQYEKFPRTRIKTIREHLKSRAPGAGTVSPDAIVGEMYFSEKLKLIQTCKTTFSQLPSFASCFKRQRQILRPTGVQVTEEKKERITQAKEIRNLLAHPKEPWRLSVLVPKEDLRDFLTWLNGLERELMDYLAQSHTLAD